MNFFVLAAANHPLAEKSDLTLADLAENSWILREEGSGTLEVFLNALPSRAKRFKTVMVNNNPESIKRAVVHGRALSCLSRMAIKREVEAGILKQLYTPYLDMRRKYFFLAHQKRHQSPLINSFLNQCSGLEDR